MFVSLRPSRPSAVEFRRLLRDSRDPRPASRRGKRAGILGRSVAISLASRRRSAQRLRAEHPGATLVDVTSKGPEPWVCLSPFYPHGGIPVPFSEGVTSESVEGIWQALKVFERADVDPSKLAIRTMRGIKRSARSLGAVRGHRRGLRGETLLDYRAARYAIYLPSYRWMLEQRARRELDALRELVGEGDVVLLDYETNADVDDLSRPLSHAALVRAYLAGEWPAPP